MVAQALDTGRMSLVKKDVAEYAGIAVPFYERWAHRHEFLLRRQQEGETVEEYFWAKQGLLVEGDTYGDMVAAYPAYWSGLRRGELRVVIDAIILGCGWDGQRLIEVGSRNPARQSPPPIDQPPACDHGDEGRFG